MSKEREVAERLMGGVTVNQSLLTGAFHFTCPDCETARIAPALSGLGKHQKIYCSTCQEFFRIVRKLTVPRRKHREENE